MINLLNVILLHVLGVTTTAFPLLYLRSRWNESRAGQVTMMSSVTLALLVDVSLVGIWFRVPEGWVVDAVTLAVFLLIFVSSVLKLIILVRGQRHDRTEGP